MTKKIIKGVGKEEEQKEMDQNITEREEGVKEDVSGAGKGDGFKNAKSGDHLVNPQPPVLIAVMGKTGTGKTSFVNAITGGELPVGSRLKSCTQHIQTASTTINGREVQLIDTPGFDDTDRSDVDILANIAEWVQRAGYLRKHLSGIIYLHRIVDMRMEGSSVKNLRMFRELCGEKNFSNVILCTTMWDKVGEEEGREREEELKSTRTFWGSLISHGAQVVRHQGDLTASARKIAESLIPKGTIVLQLQQELGQNGNLSDTSAGRFLTSEIEDMKKKHQEEMEALREEMKASSDKAEIELLKEYHEKEIEGVRKATEELEKLRAEDARRFNERLGFMQRMLDNADNLEKLRAENASRYSERLDDLQRKLDNADDLEKLRAEEARCYDIRLDDLQSKLDNSSGCIIC